MRLSLATCLLWTTTEIIGRFLSISRSLKPATFVWPGNGLQTPLYSPLAKRRAKWGKFDRRQVLSESTKQPVQKPICVMPTKKPPPMMPHTDLSISLLLLRNRNSIHLLYLLHEENIHKRLYSTPCVVLHPKWTQTNSRPATIEWEPHDVAGS